MLVSHKFTMVYGFCKTHLSKIKTNILFTIIIQPAQQKIRDYHKLKKICLKMLA